MSHFTKVTTKINDLDSLRRALDKLGCSYEPDGVVHAFDGAEIKAALAVKYPGCDYAIGVVPAEDGGESAGSYEFTADWWGLETTLGRTQDEIASEICREYAVARVTGMLEVEGYSFEGAPVVQEDGSIILAAVKW